MVSKKDARLLANHFEEFMKLVENPDKYFSSHPALAKSKDMQKTGAALYLIGDCYLAGKGFRVHPRSKTIGETIEALSDMWDAIQAEVQARGYLYPLLKGALGRNLAAVELDFMLDGRSEWSEEEEERPVLHIGDTVKTPRFLTVRIAEVFDSVALARAGGFTEPTHYEGPEYEILGKSIGENRMIFAAARK